MKESIFSSSIFPPVMQVQNSLLTYSNTEVLSGVKWQLKFSSGFLLS